MLDLEEDMEPIEGPGMDDMPMHEMAEGEEGEGKRPPPLTLQDIVQHALDGGNVADLIDDKALAGWGQDVLRDFEEDFSDNSAWRAQREAAMKATTQTDEKKSTPWPGAANVKYPLLTTASMQFSARTYSAIVPGKTIVRAMVTGDDPEDAKRQRGERVAEHMSYQILEEIEGWEDDMDALLTALPTDGQQFKKVYWDFEHGRPCVELIPADKVTVAPGTRDIETSPRVTICFERFPREVEGRVRLGRWRKLPEGQRYYDEEGDERHEPVEFLEQHTWLDLDEDGLSEPYIVICDRKNGNVARIEPRYGLEDVLVTEEGEVVSVEATPMLVPYRFMPDPEGGYFGIGFGKLLHPINATVNSILNQLIDAGTLANTQSGFIATGSLTPRSGKTRAQIPQMNALQPGKFQPVNATGASLRESIYHVQFPGPSPVLFNLLGLLIDAGKDIASIKDINGDQPANMPATTTLALIEQGMKLFTSIQRRIHRSFRKELKLIYKLNARYLDPQQYARVLDVQGANAQADYAEDDFDIAPVTDPAMASDQVKMARAQFLMQFIGAPGVDPVAVYRRVWDAAGVEDADELLMKPDPAQQALQKAQLNAAATAQFVDTNIKIAEAVAKVEKDRASAIKDLADAEAAEEGRQMETYILQLKQAAADLKGLLNGGPDQGSDSGMAGGSGGAGVSGSGNGNGGRARGPVGDGFLAPGVIGGANGAGSDGFGLPETGLA